MLKIGSAYSRTCRRRGICRAGEAQRAEGATGLISLDKTGVLS